MSDFNKGAPQVHEGTILGIPVMEIPEPRIRETGPIGVEQLLAVEGRLRNALTHRVDASDLLLRQQAQSLHEQAQQAAQDAAERVLDLVVRLVAVDQHLEERTTQMEAQQRERFDRQDRAVASLREEFEARLVGDLATLYAHLTAESEARHAILLTRLEQFQRDVERRTALGRLRRFWVWIVRSVGYGR